MPKFNRGEIPEMGYGRGASAPILEGGLTEWDGTPRVIIPPSIPSGEAGSKTIKPPPKISEPVSYQWDIPENVWQPWFGAATYAKWGGWQGTPFELPSMKQVWWRDPSWGWGLVWHPYWGWQDRETIKKLYQQYTEPVTWEQFVGFPLEKHLDQDWRKYFPERETWAEQGAAAGGGGTAGTATPYLSITGTATPYLSGAPFEFNFPAYNIPSNMLGQLYMPEPWQAANLGLLGVIGTGGAPVDVGSMIQALWGQTQSELNKRLAQEREAAGLRGTYYSSPFVEAQTRAAGDILNQFGLGAAQLQAQAQEAARERLLQALSQAQGLGGAMAEYPLQVAQQAMGMGQLMNLPYQQMQQMLYEQWQRAQQPSAWQQSAMGFATAYPPAFAGYQPGAGDFLGQLFGSLAGILPFILSKFIFKA